MKRRFKVTVECNPTVHPDYCAQMLEDVIKAALSTVAFSKENTISYDPTKKDSVKVEAWF